ncbi:hypothetical protein MTR_7g092800 [Medicago truncatula]|uniref:Uncharacterized protein n=1 Tax=Medicago truncatula TaxID=3880 RepID=G7KUI1_MEDTR|nr:hypothetical protein MTR_7g092800 [Medicago truncatula]
MEKLQSGGTSALTLGLGIGQARPGFDRPELGLWPIFLAWPGLKAYLQAYLLLKSLNIPFYLLLNRLYRPQSFATSVKWDFRSQLSAIGAICFTRRDVSSTKMAL